MSTAKKGVWHKRGSYPLGVNWTLGFLFYVQQGWPLSVTITSSREGVGDVGMFYRTRVQKVDSLLRCTLMSSIKIRPYNFTEWSGGIG